MMPLPTQTPDSFQSSKSGPNVPLTLGATAGIGTVAGIAGGFWDKRGVEKPSSTASTQQMTDAEAAVKTAKAARDAAEEKISKGLNISGGKSLKDAQAELTEKEAALASLEGNGQGTRVIDIDDKGHKYVLDGDGNVTSVRGNELSLSRPEGSHTFHVDLSQALDDGDRTVEMSHVIEKNGHYKGTIIPDAKIINIGFGSDNKAFAEITMNKGDDAKNLPLLETLIKDVDDIKPAVKINRTTGDGQMYMDILQGKMKGYQLRIDENGKPTGVNKTGLITNFEDVSSWLNSEDAKNVLDESSRNALRDMKKDSDTGLETLVGKQGDLKIASEKIKNAENLAHHYGRKLGSSEGVEVLIKKQKKGLPDSIAKLKADIAPKLVMLDTQKAGDSAYQTAQKQFDEADNARKALSAVAENVPKFSGGKAALWGSLAAGLTAGTMWLLGRNKGEETPPPLISPPTPTLSPAPPPLPAMSEGIGTDPLNPDQPLQGFGSEGFTA